MMLVFSVALIALTFLAIHCDIYVFLSYQYTQQNTSIIICGLSQKDTLQITLNFLRICGGSFKIFGH